MVRVAFVAEGDDGVDAIVAAGQLDDDQDRTIPIGCHGLRARARKVGMDGATATRVARRVEALKKSRRDVMGKTP